MIDLNEEEGANVRRALGYLRHRAGSWKVISASIGFERGTLMNVMSGRRPGVKMAFRIARMAGVPLEDVLTGKFPPPWTCPHCGHRDGVAGH